MQTLGGGLSVVGSVPVPVRGAEGPRRAVRRMGRVRVRRTDQRTGRKRALTSCCERGKFGCNVWITGECARYGKTLGVRNEKERSVKNAASRSGEFSVRLLHVVGNRSVVLVRKIFAVAFRAPRAFCPRI